jgi:hypothetical protein
MPDASRDPKVPCAFLPKSGIAGRCRAASLALLVTRLSLLFLAVGIEAATRVVVTREALLSGTRLIFAIALLTGAALTARPALLVALILRLAAAIV